MPRLYEIFTGRPIQFGAEKERKLSSFTAATNDLDAAQLYAKDRFQPSLLGPSPPRDWLKPGVQTFAVWTDLSDAGKAAYLRAARQPKLKAKRGAPYARLAWETGGYLELISPRLERLDQLHEFLQRYGWGHIHVSFPRGLPEAAQRGLLQFWRDANLWLFIRGLQSRGASANGDPLFRFSVTGLSIPTQEHEALARTMIASKNRVATAFSKHLLLSVRGNGKQYGERDRIGLELRGGVSQEKKLLLDALLSRLSSGAWPSSSSSFQLPILGEDLRTYQKRGRSRPRQVKAIPGHFERRLVELGIDPARADRLGAALRACALGAERPARLLRFDQRAMVPILNYESWLTPATKLLRARGRFLKGLLDLELERPDLAQRYVALCEVWAKEAQLAEAIWARLSGSKYCSGRT